MTRLPHDVHFVVRRPEKWFALHFDTACELGAMRVVNGLACHRRGASLGGGRKLAPRNLTERNGALYFTTTNLSGPSLWTSDGTEAGTVPIIPPGEGFTRAMGLANVNGTLFFAAADDILGRALWTSDGTPGGTVLVKDPDPTGIGSIPSRFQVVHRHLFRSADDQFTVSFGGAGGIRFPN